MKRVRLKVAATVPVVLGEGIPDRHDWMPAGSECDLADEHFDASIHEPIVEPVTDSPAPESPAASAQGTDSATSADPSV
jgi:hypothetical protein